MFVVLAVWDALLYRYHLRTDAWNYLFNAAVGILYIFTFVIALWHSRQPQIPKLSRKIFVYLGLAALVWGIGSLIWAYYNLIVQVSVPYPSFADLFFVLSYPLWGMAVWSLHESYHKKATQRAINESAAIVVISAVVIFAFLNRPDLSPDLGLIKNLLNVAYSLGDVLLVAMSLIELRSGVAKRHKGVYLLIGFFLLQAGGDFTFAYRNNSGSYWNGDVSDLLFGLSGFILGLVLAQNSLVTDNKRK
jgi:hypothetical protein